MQNLLILLAGGIAMTVGDLVAGKWVQNKNKFLYIVVIILYLIGLNFLIQSYRYSDIAIASILFDLFNVITLTVAGIYLFKENITKTELAGIIVGFVSIVILQL